MRMRGGLLLLVVATFPGCGDDDEMDCSQVEYQTCDIRLSPCQNLIFDQMRCLRGGAALDRRPRSVVVSATDLKEQLLDAYEEEEELEVDPDRQAAQAALSVLGLLDPADTSTEAQVDFQVDSLLGFYSHETKEVVIVDHGSALDDELSTTTLGHEYVHALQDAEFDLARHQREASFSFDANLAAVSAIEGEAMLYDGFQLAKIRGHDPSDLDWTGYYAEFTNAADDLAAEERSPLLAARAIFPYTYGAFVAALRHASSGPSGLATGRKHDHSSQAFLAPRHEASRYVPDGFPEELAVTDVPGRRWLGSEGLGAWLLHGLAVRLLGEPRVPERALAWRGDALSLFDPESSDATEFVWKVRWTTAARATAFAERLASATLPNGGSLAAFADGEVTTVIGNTAEGAALDELGMAVEMAEQRRVASGAPVPSTGAPTPGRLGRILAAVASCVR